MGTTLPAPSVVGLQRTQSASHVDPTGEVELDVLLDQLPADQRDAFVLTQLFGYRYDEAAEICGCPTGTIRSRVARARATLAAVVARARNEPADGIDALLPVHGVDQVATAFPVDSSVTFTNVMDTLLTIRAAFERDQVALRSGGAITTPSGQSVGSSRCGWRDIAKSSTGVCGGTCLSPLTKTTTTSSCCDGPSARCTTSHDTMGTGTSFGL
jgi:hypothetical protein